MFKAKVGEGEGERGLEMRARAVREQEEGRERAWREGSVIGERGQGG